MNYQLLIKMMIPLLLISNSFGETIPIEVAHKSPEMDSLLHQNSRLERVATGFQFVEGPVWMGSQREGYLLFSDIPANRVYQWIPQSGEVYVKIDLVQAIRDHLVSKILHNDARILGVLVERAEILDFQQNFHQCELS